MFASSSGSYRHWAAVFVAIMCAVAMLPGCGGSGGGSAAEPSVQKSAVVLGKLAPAKAGFVAVADADPITVHVLSDPDIKATVGADGTFTLRGLPEGSFTLVFMQGAAEVGRLVGYSAESVRRAIRLGWWLTPRRNLMTT